MKTAGETRGNGVVAVLIHDESPEAAAVLEQAVLSAFRFQGIPFRILSLERGVPDGFFRTEAARLAAVLFPQPGSMGRLSPSSVSEMLQAVQEGLGLLAYEPRVQELPGAVLKLFRVDPTSVSNSAFRTVSTLRNDHYLTWTRPVGEVVRSDKPVPYSILPKSSTDLVGSESGHPLLLCGEAGKGRTILFPFDVRLFTLEHLGHACGLDDVFQKSVLWTARKPFLTYSMPHFATMAIDDSSGSYNHFRYVDALSAHGWKPNLGLFTDTIDEVAHETADLDSKKLRELDREGRADVGFHALRYNESFCFDHLGQRPLTGKELDERFARWDHYERKWGFKASPWIHPHFGEISLAAMPYFKARGAEFVTHFLPFDAAWFEVPEKKPPLDPQPPFGHNGYFQFNPSASPDFLAVNCVLEKKTRESPDFVVKADYLWGNTVFWDEAPRTRIPQIAQTISEQARRGIDSGFYGQTLTHEQRIACLKPEEWEEIWKEADKLLSRYTLEHRRHSEILPYVKRRRQCALTSVEVDAADRSVRYAFDSDMAVGTRVQLHRNADRDGVESAQHEIRSRSGKVTE